MAHAVSYADKLSLNESGAITIFILKPLVSYQMSSAKQLENAEYNGRYDG